MITDYLRKKLLNKYINSIEIYGGRYSKKLPKNYNKIINLLQRRAVAFAKAKGTPLKVYNVNSYGKFIYMEFHNTDITLWNTLGMSGWWQINEEKHNHIGASLSLRQSLVAQRAKNYIFI
jgi:formamidopyrimidine-DNA glycosylase